MPFILGGILEGPRMHEGLPQRLSGKTPPASAGDTGLIPGTGTSPGEGNGNALQYSCLENPWTEEPGRLQSMGSQSQTRLSVSAETTQWVEASLQKRSAPGAAAPVLLV